MIKYASSVLILMAVLSSQVLAQQPVNQPPPGAAVPLQSPFPAPPGQLPVAGAPIVNVQVVISIYEGDKKISSRPYTLAIIPGKNSSLRNGAEVAIPTTSFGSGKPGTDTVTPYTMQQIGTSIDCIARPTNDNRYELTLTVTDRFVYPSSKTNQLGGTVANVPTFRNVSSSSVLILGNGQSAQFTASTDTVTGEVFKVDVTLTVLK